MSQVLGEFKMKKNICTQINESICKAKKKINHFKAIHYLLLFMYLFAQLRENLFVPNLLDKSNGPDSHASGSVFTI